MASGEPWVSCGTIPIVGRIRTNIPGHSWIPTVYLLFDTLLSFPPSLLCIGIYNALALGKESSFCPSSATDTIGIGENVSPTCTLTSLGDGNWLHSTACRNIVSEPHLLVFLHCCGGNLRAIPGSVIT